MSLIAGAHLEFDIRRESELRVHSITQSFIRFQSESYYTILRASFRLDESISRVYGTCGNSRECSRGVRAVDASPSMFVLDDEIAK